MNYIRKRFPAVLYGISGTAFILRLIVGFQLMSADPAVKQPLPVTDMATYLELAEKILHGNFPQVFYYQPFYYSVFLPAVQFFTGPSPVMIMTAQAFCGAAAVFFAGLCGAVTKGRKAGILTALFAAFAQISLIYVPYALLEVQQSLWLVLSLYLLLRLWKKPRPSTAFWTGVVFACAILSRGSAWIFPPLAFGFLFVRRKCRKLSVLLLFGIGLLLPQLPFLAVNTLHEGVPTGPSTAGPAVLTLGNTPEAPAGGLEYPRSYQVWMDGQNERSVPLRIFDFLIESPGAYLELTFRKLLLFWDSMEIPNNISPERSLNLSFAGILIPTGLLLALAVSMILMNLRSGGTVRIVLFYLLAYYAATSAFYLLARFRVPAIPLVCICAGWIAAVNFRNRKKVLLFSLCLASGLFLAYGAYPCYRYFGESTVIRIVRPDGTLLKLSDGRWYIHDHGPRQLGGWTPVTIRNYKKKFAHPELFRGKRVNLTLHYAVTGAFREPSIQVNGENIKLNDLRPGQIHTAELVLDYPGDGLFQILLSDSVVMFVDFQRNYGRTEAVPGELTAELETLK